MVKMGHISAAISTFLRKMKGDSMLKGRLAATTNQPHLNVLDLEVVPHVSQYLLAKKSYLCLLTLAEHGCTLECSII